jgi:hypothetical protein
MLHVHPHGHVVPNEAPALIATFLKADPQSQKTQGRHR